MGKKYLIEYDRDACIGAAACVAVQPDQWSIVDDGKADLKDSKKEGKILIKEIDRVTTNLLFMSLISGDNDRHGVGEIIRTVHERGTIQSYYNWKKILRLISVTNFKLKWCSLISEKSLLSRGKNSRYYIVLEKK